MTNWVYGAFLIVWILNAWNIQVNHLGANFLNEISLKSMWFCSTEPHTSSSDGNLSFFILLIVMERYEVLWLTQIFQFMHLETFLQHLSATEIALKMGTGSVWWHQKWWKWNFLEFPHPETSLQFYVLWVEICTRGDLQASVSFCCWFLKLLPFLECLGFTSLLLWQMWQRAQTQDLCSALCSGPGIPCDGRQFIHGFCNSLPTCKGTCW